MNQHKSIYNWLGLGVLALIVLGLGYVTMSGRTETKPDETLSPPPLPPSPLASSPLSADLASPLPTQAPPTLTAEAILPFELTVLHSNDTWGYLLPCG